jgi:CheY-like chemotaxis protein
MRTILVVEDYDDVRQILRVLLESENFRVLEAASGTAALEVLEKERPDVILMDLALPGVDGLEAIRRIRTIDRFQNTPIIVLSAYNRPSTCAAALAAGGDYFRTKPIDFDELAALLQKILSEGNTRSSKRASIPRAVLRSKPMPPANGPELTYRV